MHALSTVSKLKYQLTHISMLSPNIPGEGKKNEWTTKKLGKMQPPAITGEG